jgi:UDP-N-acetylmuramyl pentapeptide phosphotransferase/UDP-N-acetylglucosamine-1-phosphate transferase
MSLSDFSVIAGVSFAVSLFLVLTRHWHGRFSMDHTEGVQKFHTEPTPRIGGVAIFAAMVVGWLTAADQVKELIAPLLLASLPAFAFGMLEDVTKRVGEAV